MNICEPQTKEEFEKYYDLRWRMLRKPWGKPRGSEKDEREDQSIHLMACKNNKNPVGVGRAHFNSPEEAQIRYMAVATAFQREHIGTRILQELEKQVQENGAKYIVLNARENAVGFYKKHGYHIVEKAHTLFGSIPHYKMKKS